MKRTFIIIGIIFFAVPCAAQWRFAGFDLKINASCTHDTNFFVGYQPVFSDDPLIYRHAISEADTVWHGADNGIDRTQGNIVSFAALGTSLFAGPAGGRQAYSSTNDGSVWNKMNIGGPVGANSNYLFAGYGNIGIARSRDGGNNWDSITNLSVNSFAAFGINIFANTGSGIWRSRDTGNNWSQLSPPFVGTMTIMDSLVFMVGNGMLIESSDSGTKWDTVSVDSGSVRETVNCLTTDAKNLFAGTTHGVFLSTDVGKTWKPQNEGLPFPNVTTVAVFDTLLFVQLQATNKNYYAYWHSIPEMLDTNPASVVQPPAGDTIAIYPNPSTGAVTVTSGNVPILHVRVSSVLGTPMLDIPSLYQSGVSFDMSKFPSGTYFVQIQTLEGTILRKIVRE